jgi:hypothetical protein
MIVAQYDLHERDVEFFAKMRRVDMYDPRHVFQMKFRWTKPPIWEMFVTMEEHVLLFRLIQYLEGAYSEQGGDLLPGKKVLVLCASKKMARRLFCYLGRLIDSGQLNVEKHRLKLLDGDNQIGDWEKRFMEDPDDRAS